MRFKQLTARILTAVMILASVSFPTNDAAMTQVYADEPKAVSPEGADSALFKSNIAAGKSVKASDTANDDGIFATNVNDQDLQTVWTSQDITGVTGATSAWIQIDLGKNATDYPVDSITVKFNGKAWTDSYTVKTSYTAMSLNADSWNTVRERNSEDYTAEGDSKSDTFDRNRRNEKMVLRRYVRFIFEGLNEEAIEADLTGVSVAEIVINGTEPTIIPLPESVTLTPPEEGKYPSIADLRIDTSVRHTSLSDKTAPAAHFMRQDGTDTNWQDETREIGDGDKTTVTAPRWDYTEADAAGKLAEDEIFEKDGIAGFNAQVHTPGTVNKFDAWYDDVVVISFQLYLDAFPSTADTATTNGSRHLFAKGNKYSCSLTRDKKIVAAMHAQGSQWVEVKYQLDDNALDSWHDILIVIDGHGYLRLYVDGTRAQETSANASGNAYLNKGAPAGGFKPFSLCYSEAADRNGDNTIVTGKTFLQKSEGYIGRFKFYTNADHNNILDETGQDLTDAVPLSNDFVDTLNIQQLETTCGEANVGKVITNMLQSESPTARITLTPYTRSTIWQKYDNNEWVNMGATEKFGANTTKYRAVTKLVSDDRFLFDESIQADIIKNNIIDAGQDALITANVTDKRRELDIICYYNCTGNDDPAIEDNECEIEEMALGQSEVDYAYETSAITCVQKDDGTWDDRVIIEPTATVTTCINHAAAKMKYSYKLTQATAVTPISPTNPIGQSANEYMLLETKEVEVDDEIKTVATIKPKKSSKLTMGYAPLTIQVTGALTMPDGTIVKKTVNGKEVEIKQTEIIRVKIDSKEQKTDTVIDVAPKLTVTSPKTNTYPRVATVSISPEAPHYTDIADRTTPASTLTQLTNSTREQYLNEMLEAGTINTMPPADELDTIPNPTIVNKDSVFGFNAQGQTPGDTNKFTVYKNDVKVIAFKLWLEKWPETKTLTPMVSLFAKGNQYAVQLDRSRKSIKMFMWAGGNSYPEEEYKPAGEELTNFLKKWHTIFMVVDGKGKQRLYVDGNPSSTTKGGNALSDDTIQKPFTMGYNFEDGDGKSAKNWWRQTFTADFGYFADFEFYTNKDYNNMVTGDGDDISRAEILSPEIAAKINIAELEENSPNDLDAVITNLLQTSNPTVNITVNPYTAQTIWQQIDEDGNASEPEPTEPFAAVATYISTTTITAHDGFVFGDDIIQSVRDQFTVLPATGETEADTPELQVKLLPKDGVANKVLKVVATYGETDDLPCDCKIAEFAYPGETSVSMMIEGNQDSAVMTLQAPTGEEIANAITMQCPSKKHADAEYEYTLSYAADSSNKAGVIDFDSTTKTITALGSGTAKIIATVEAKLKNVPDDEQISGVTKTVPITVTVDKKAGAQKKAELQAAIDAAKDDYPDDQSTFYQGTPWGNLQTALSDAAALIANPDATEAQIDNAKKAIDDKKKALEAASAKSDLGKAKDKADQALAAAKVLIDAGNKDKDGKEIYTANSWQALLDAYDALKDMTPTDMAKMQASALNTLATTLSKAAEEGADGLVKVTPDKPGDEPGPGQNTGSKLTLNAEIKGADGTAYKVTDNVKNEVTVVKGTDVANVKISDTVVLNTVTCKIVGIEKDAFKGLKKVKNVQIGNNVAFIGATAFSGCPNLKAVTIGTGIKMIGQKAFFKCKKLKKVVLKANTAPTVQKAAFKKTAKNIKIKLPKNLKKDKKFKKTLKKAGIKKGL